MDNLEESGSKKIPEASNFVNVYAEVAGCTIYTLSNSGHKMANFMFIINEPVPYEDTDGNITKQTYQKKKVAAITMNADQARAFYESIKHQFEGN